ncbi:MAG: hypothetical protein WDM91_08980 [Rhizomicrobium sp.]
MSDIETPVDPKSTAGYRAAKLAVIVLSALIILALVGLVAGMVLKMSGRPVHLLGGTGPEAAGNAAGTAVFTLPPGAKLVSMDSQPGRLILHLRTGNRDQIDILDTDDGHLVAKIAAPDR